MACNPDCSKSCCNARAKPCGCEWLEICSSCEPEQYFYQVEKRKLHNVAKLMGKEHHVTTVKPDICHLLRPEFHRNTYCGRDAFVHNLLVTRNEDNATCRACLKKHTPLSFKLTYVFRLLLGVPLYFIGRAGVAAWNAHGWITRHTWAPRFPVREGSRLRMWQRFVNHDYDGNFLS